MLAEFPALSPYVEQFMAKPDDSEAEARIKNVLVGVASDVASGAFVKGLRAIRQARQVKATIGGATFADSAEIAEQLQKSTGQPLTRNMDPMARLGDPAGDPVTVGTATGKLAGGSGA